VSASVDLPLHHKAQKFCSGTGSPGWSQIKGRKTVVVVVSRVRVRAFYPLPHPHPISQHALIFPSHTNTGVI